MSRTVCQSEFLNDRKGRKGRMRQEEEEDDEDDVTTTESGSEGEEEEFDESDESDFEQEKIKNRLKDAPEKEEVQWNYSRTLYRIAGSLSGFNKLSSDPEVGISADALGVYGPTESSSKDGPVANGAKKKSHMIDNMWITDVKSSFPCALSLEVVGLGDNVKTKKNYTSTGKSASFFIMPNQDFSHKEKSDETTLISASQLPVDHSFFEKYPGRTAANIREGITEVPGHYDKKLKEFVSSGKVLIHESHPVMAMFDAAREQQGEKKISQKMKVLNHCYEADAESAEKLIGMIEENLNKRMQISDLNDVRFRLSRPFQDDNSNFNTEKPNGSTPRVIESRAYKKKASATNCEKACKTDWTHSCEIMEGISNSVTARERVISEPHSLYFVILTKYRQL